MPTIYVKKAFNLRHGGQKHEFPVGNHQVSEQIAKHWFVKAHTGDEPPVDPESAAAADALRVQLEEEVRTLADVATNLNERQRELDEREKAADQRETDLNARAEALDTREVAIAEREKAAEAAAKQTGKK